jgi:glycolate oxidase FAD binding subunit
VLWDGTSVWVLLEGHREDVVTQAAALGLRDADPPDDLPSGGRWSLPPGRLHELAGSGRFVAEIGVGVVHHESPQPTVPVDPTIVELHRRLKHQFDPAGRLNPGVDVLQAG